QDTAKTLNPALYPTAASPPPTDAQNVSMMNSTIDFLNRLAGSGSGSGAVAARRLAAAMSALAKADSATRQRAEVVFVQPLRTALDDLRNLLKAHEITRDNLPPELVSQWMTPGGQARLEIAPSGNTDNNATLRTF